MKMKIAIDLNVRVRGDQTYVGFEEIVGGFPQAPAVGDPVEVTEPEAGLCGEATITEIDFDRELIYLQVDWASLRAVDAPNSQNPVGPSANLVFVWSAAPPRPMSLNSAGARTIELRGEVSSSKVAEDLKQLEKAL